MKRKLSLSTIINAVGFIRYLPAIIFQIKNWLNFILHYLNIDKGASEYIFRNGIKIKTKDAVSSATIAVIFIKKDYGDVPDNSIVIDIGANIGVYSIFSAIGKKTTIFAYEPMLDNFNLLKENIKLNQLENRIFPFNVAVSAKKEKRKLYLGESPLHSFLPKDESPFNAMFGHSEENQQQEYTEVDCVSLKDIFDDNKIDYCDILKMDCEGAEYEILYNLPQNYFNKIKKIRLEYHNHNNNINNSGNHMVKFLVERGFKLEKKREGSSYQGDLWFSRV